LLLPAEGEGRNAIYAALKGWKVHALDYSESASNKAKILASENQVNISYELADLEEWDKNLKVDVVAFIFAHFNPQIRESIHKKFITKLNPGGKILIEAFSKKQLNYDSGGPKDYGWLYSPKLLRNDFETLNIQSLQERTLILDEGELHQGEASIIRMIAQKPD
jgi:cyclopropane fatty-acyl-phospholipid synthase-like methyltransferase